MRIAGWVAFAAAIACAGPAIAAAPLPFDPEEATRAWIATIGPEALERSNRYYTGGYIIQIADALLTIAIAIALLVVGWARGVRSWLERTVKFFPLVAFGAALFYLVVSTLIVLPFSYYVGFVREHRFGLSTQTLPQWLGEWAMGAGIGVVVGAILATIIYLIIRAAKNTWWIWGSAVTMVFMGALIMAGPVFIAPLFNEYTPMQEGELKDDILELAQANGVPADNVYVFDASRQSNRVTANVSGLFGTTRISLADNLLNRASNDDVVRAVMGHEIGHYVLGHIYSILIMTSMLTLITFAAAHFGFRAIARNERWGIRDIADPAGLPLLAALIAAIGLVTLPLQRNLTRFHEVQADMFGLNAARAPDGFAEAAVLLSEYRKMTPTPLEEWVFYTHPSGRNRIHRSMVWKAHEIAAGRLLPSAGGPPEDWRPDFVVLRERGASATPAPSPAAASD